MIDTETNNEATNPLLGEWQTPFAVPPFAEIEDHHFEPAMRAAMDEQKAEVTAIVETDEAPTFANTIEALERTGQLLRRVARVFFTLNGSHSSEAIRRTARQLAPEISAHRDDITLDKALFERIERVYAQRQTLALEGEQLKLLQETRKDFVRAGVHLEPPAQERLRAINRELAELAQQYSQNLLAELGAFELHVTRQEDLGALPEGLVASAAAEARRRGHTDGWSFTPARPSIEPFLQYSPNRRLRRQIFAAFARQGAGGNGHDNRTGLVRMAALRAERALLLGYETHAHYVLADAMAETPERVYELLDKVWQPALAVAESERENLQAMLLADGVEGDLQPWDWRYYAEKVRQARFDLDEEALRPYFELTAVRDGAFLLAGKLFGLTFSELEEVPKWHPDQQVFEVQKGDGSHLGVLYMDFFARESKRGGAWMNDLRAQSRLDGEVRPIITNDFNFAPPADGSPALLSFDDAETVFHEFGHALHGLLSDVTYASLSGTNVPRDFVEFPSQLMENWMSEPELLRLYARHYRTGEVIPDELITKIRSAGKFNQGFRTVEYMAACYLDMAWHDQGQDGLEALDSATAETFGPETFESRAMRGIGLLREIIPRYRSAYFAHIFSGGYSAGYYGYLWSEVLDADAFEAFQEQGLFHPPTAHKLERLLSQGGCKPGMELYRAFRGREPAVDALLARRGLAAAG
ncbi:MAG: M3 family metallopeptidase [Acidobacteriota bacterium]